MKAVFLALAVAASAADQYPPGRYAAKVTGMLCRACALALEQELAKLDEVEGAKADFDAESLELTVKDGKRLKEKTLRKALRRASKRINLDTKLELAELTAAPAPK